MKPALTTTKNQLLLFDRDTSTSECGNSYQAGDWVKLRRKPRIAAWVKRGDIFKINAVNPKDGSMRFWNPHINQWDFLYPEEVRLTLPPKEESVVGESQGTVESVVGESQEIVESVVGESQGTVESVVGEIAKKTVQSVVGEIAKETVESVVGEIAKETVESVVGEIAKETVESVVGESQRTVESVVGEIAKETVESIIGKVAKETVESVVGEIAKKTVQSVVGEVAKETVQSKNYWNSNKGYSGNGWLESHYKIRVDGKQRSINCPETRCTGPYSSYRWMDKKRQRSKYVIASKYMAVDRAIKSGKSITEILEIISNP
jgi:histone H3/H4